MKPYALCPKCDLRIDLDDETKMALESKRGRMWELECTNGHLFSLHDGMLAAKLQPSHYNVFWHIQGIESGQENISVGKWHTVRLQKPFEEIDDIKLIYYTKDDIDISGVRCEAKFDKKDPNYFWLVTSGDEVEWGRKVCIDWTVYGVVPTDPLDIWRETLIFAARQLLAANYRPAILQSAVAIESFVYSFVIDYLKKTKGWRSTTVDDYIDASKSRDALSLQGVIQVCIQEVMGLSISEEVWVGWQRLRKMRNALAHGDLQKYRRLSGPDGQYFTNDKSKAEFAYRTAVKFIYEIRYSSGEESLIC